MGWGLIVGRIGGREEEDARWGERLDGHKTTRGFFFAIRDWIMS